MKAAISYIKDVQFELSKVVWPKKEEVVKLTIIVFLISGIIGAFLGLVDFAFTKLLEYIIIL